MSPSYTILHRDDTLVVVNKAPGILTVSRPGSRERCLLDDLRADGLPVSPVHRLDRSTSGILLLCLDQDHRSEIEDLFKKRKVKKDYVAAVHGVPSTKRGTIDLPILDLGATAKVDKKGRRAVTHFTVQKIMGRASLLQIRLDTGRHNQIRVHLAHTGHPIIGDRKYGRRDRKTTTTLPPVKRPLLHAEGLSFAHPVSGKSLSIQAPIPPDMAQFLSELDSKK